MSLRSIVIQLMVIGIMAALFAGFGNQRLAMSALLGAFSCWLPNAWFALRLRRSIRPGKPASPVNFLTGEAVKVLVTVLLLVLSHWLYRELSWPALLVGMVVALKSNLIVLFIRK